MGLLINYFALKLYLPCFCILESVHRAFSRVVQIALQGPKYKFLLSFFLSRKGTTLKKYNKMILSLAIVTSDRVLNKSQLPAKMAV